jgi:hypothetical protein
MPSEIIKSTSSNNEEEDINAKNKRKQQNKFAIMTPNTTHSLRRDLLLSNFDRNMTVEKAKFEPAEEPIISIQLAPTLTTSTAINTAINTAIIPKTDNTFIPVDIVKWSDPNNDQPILSISPPPQNATYALTQSPSAPTLSASTSASTINLSTTVNDRRRLTQVRSEVMIT